MSPQCVLTPFFIDSFLSNSLRKLSAGYVSDLNLCPSWFRLTVMYSCSFNDRLNTRRQLRLVHSRMINEMDASAIVRDDLRLHFRTPMTQTMNTVRLFPSPIVPRPLSPRRFLLTDRLLITIDPGRASPQCRSRRTLLLWCPEQECERQRGGATRRNGQSDDEEKVTENGASCFSPRPLQTIMSTAGGSGSQPRAALSLRGLCDL